MLTSRDVLVIDEAGMVGTRQLKRVLSHAVEAGAKVVLVGDPQQLQSIEAGAAFRSIHERQGGAEIGEVRRKRTWHLIELGGLVVKAGIVDLTGDDRTVIYGALLWIADKLQSDQGEHARALWVAKGKQAFEADPATHQRTDLTVSAVRR